MKNIINSFSNLSQGACALDGLQIMRMTFLVSVFSLSACSTEPTPAMYMRMGRPDPMMDLIRSGKVGVNEPTSIITDSEKFKNDKVFFHTPLCNALYDAKNEGALKELIRLGADVNYRCNDPYHSLPLDLLAYQTHTKVLIFSDILLKAGARSEKNINSSTIATKNWNERFKEELKYLAFRDRNYELQKIKDLLDEAQQKHLAIDQDLLVMLSNSMQDPIMRLRDYHPDARMYMQVAKMLVAAGVNAEVPTTVNPIAAITSHENGKMNVLQTAVLAGQEDFARLLIQFGMNPNVRTDKGRSLDDLRRVREQYLASDAVQKFLATKNY